MRFFGSSAIGATALLAGAAAFPAERDVPNQFFLQTSLANGSTDATKDCLYLTSYHTGAGIADATLSSNKSIAIDSFLNGTYLQFQAGQQGFPIGLFLYGDTNYASRSSNHVVNVCPTHF